MIRVVRPSLPGGLTTEGARDVTVSVTIEPIESTTRLSLAPTVEGLAPGLEAAFQTDVQLTLRGLLPVLNALEEGEVRAVLDLAGFGSGTFEIEVRIEAPDGVTVEMMTPETVEVVIS